ncbi:MAG: hypothetical protein ACXVW5_31615 [Solirubrobacteraceae bacterium]
MLLDQLREFAALLRQRSGPSEASPESVGYFTSASITVESILTAGA